MPLYEHVFLARQDASAQQVDDLTTQFKAIIEGSGGKVAKTEYWGVKSLTYRMNKNRKAHFTLMNIDAPPAAINEIERQERLSEDVLRYITIRVEELEEGPSAMMRKSIATIVNATAAASAAARWRIWWRRPLRRSRPRWPAPRSRRPRSA